MRWEAADADRPSAHTSAAKWSIQASKHRPLATPPNQTQVQDMDWQGRIVTTPDTLFGRPRIAGTRIGVDFVLELLASGWSSQRILDEYPQLKPDDLQAVFAFVRDCLKDEDFVLQAKAAEGLPG
jgi:uncharacterized protein (DUF433 family)